MFEREIRAACSRVLSSMIDAQDLTTPAPWSFSVTISSITLAPLLRAPTWQLPVRPVVCNGVTYDGTP